MSHSNDSTEPGSTGGTINAVNRYAGIDVSVYLTPEAWQELVAVGSTEVHQAYQVAPADARVVRVTIHHP